MGQNISGAMTKDQIFCYGKEKMEAEHLLMALVVAEVGPVLEVVKEAGGVFWVLVGKGLG